MALFIPSATAIPDINYITSCVSIIIGTTAIQVIREICFSKWSVGGSEELVQFLVLVGVKRYFLGKAGEPRTAVLDSVCRRQSSKENARGSVECQPSRPSEVRQKITSGKHIRGAGQQDQQDAGGEGQGGGGGHAQ